MFDLNNCLFNCCIFLKNDVLTFKLSATLGKLTNFWFLWFLFDII